MDQSTGKAGIYLMSRFYLVQPGNHEDPRIQLSKKQLIWLLKNTKIADHLNILEIKPGEFKGEYLSSYELRKLVEGKL